MKEAFEQEKIHRETPEKLRSGVDTLMNLFVHRFQIEGKEKLITSIEQNPDAKFIIASSHFSNLDAPAAVKALGDQFDIQIAASSNHFGFTPQAILFNLAGKENFSPIEYTKNGKNSTGVFNPEDFERLTGQMEEGKTPWIAIHPFSTEDVMKDARIGSVYLAHKTGAKIIPTTLEIKGDSISLEGAKELAKGLASRLRENSEAIFHIGDIIDVADIDVDIIDKVLQKRANHEHVSSEEKEEFKKILEMLRNEADGVAQKIADMLPPEQRGVYGSASPKALPSQN